MENYFYQSLGIFYSYDKNKSCPNLNKFAIWIDEINISLIRKSLNLFIDDTWYKPDDFKQILIILYKDIIINENILVCYIIVINKKFFIYKKALEAFKNKIFFRLNNI